MRSAHKEHHISLTRKSASRFVEVYAFEKEKGGFWIRLFLGNRFANIRHICSNFRALMARSVVNFFFKTKAWWQNETKSSKATLGVFWSSVLAFVWKMTCLSKLLCIFIFCVLHGCSGCFQFSLNYCLVVLFLLCILCSHQHSALEMQSFSFSFLCWTSKLFDLWSSSFLFPNHNYLLLVLPTFFSFLLWNAKKEKFWRARGSAARPKL